MDRKEFDTHIISLKNKVFRFARTILKSTVEAEDVTQDIFEKLWKNKEHISKYNSVEAFVIQSTKNLCYDKIKHNNVVLKSSEEIKYTTSVTTHSEKENFDTHDIVKNAISALPDKQRVIMHLRDIEGYEFEQIAEVTGDEINAIRVSLSRARKTVREELIKTMNYGL